MKKVAIITINDNDNYGNRLQNYAVQKFFEKNNIIAETISNDGGLYLDNIPRLIKIKSFNLLKKYIFRNKYKRYNNFLKFNKNINYSKEDLNHIVNNNKNLYDYYVVGSDQVWNPNFKTTTIDKFLTFTTSSKKISFSASLGVNKLNYDETKLFEQVKDFKAISVREDKGKELLEKITNRNDIEVLIDPTMLLDKDEWNKVANKPDIFPEKKYILNYFLGNISLQRKQEIERVAKENDCEIINLLDKNDPYYSCGPSEFLYLEKNAFLICTDSFHSCVFSILFERPFIVFDRDDKEEKMNSRIDTLLNKFQLTDKKFSNSLIKENLLSNYSKTREILKKERQKVDIYFEKNIFNNDMGEK